MDSENLEYNTTPLRSEGSNSLNRRKCIQQASLAVYKNKVELNSTALVPGNVIESMPLYSPQKKVQNVRNPFEQSWLLKERLSQPMCSPSMFQKHISPIHKSSTFSWTVDDISSLCPAPIDECPSQEFTSWFSPDTETQAQEAIDRFFTSLSQGTLESPIVTKPSSGAVNVACQTKLTFPPILPDAIEAQLEALSRGCAVSLDESMNTSNCSARRKILAADLDNYSSGDESDATVSEQISGAIFGAIQSIIKAKSMTEGIITVATLSPKGALQRSVLSYFVDNTSPNGRVSVRARSYQQQKDTSILPQYAATPLRRPMSSPEVSPIRIDDACTESPINIYNEEEEEEDCQMSICVGADNTDSLSR